MTKIEIARKKRGLTQEDLANRLGVSKEYICNLEADIFEPSHSMLLTLSRLLYVSIDYLLGNEDYCVRYEDDGDHEPISMSELDELIFLYASAPPDIREAIFWILKDFLPSSSK